MIKQEYFENDDIRQNIKMEDQEYEEKFNIVDNIKPENDDDFNHELLKLIKKYSADFNDDDDELMKLVEEFSNDVQALKKQKEEEKEKELAEEERKRAEKEELKAAEEEKKRQQLEKEKQLEEQRHVQELEDQKKHQQEKERAEEAKKEADEAKRKDEERRINEAVERRLKDIELEKKKLAKERKAEAKRSKIIEKYVKSRKEIKTVHSIEISSKLKEIEECISIVQQKYHTQGTKKRIVDHVLRDMKLDYDYTKNHFELIGEENVSFNQIDMSGKYRTKSLTPGIMSWCRDTQKIKMLANLKNDFPRETQEIENRIRELSSIFAKIFGADCNLWLENKKQNCFCCPNGNLILGHLCTLREKCKHINESLFPSDHKISFFCLYDFRKIRISSLYDNCCATIRR